MLELIASRTGRGRKGRRRTSTNGAAKGSLSKAETKPEADRRTWPRPSNNWWTGLNLRATSNPLLHASTSGSFSAFDGFTESWIMYKHFSISTKSACVVLSHLSDFANFVNISAKLLQHLVKISYFSHNFDKIAPDFLQHLTYFEHCVKRFVSLE